MPFVSEKLLRPLAAGVALGAALLLASCGGGGSDSDSRPASAFPPSSTLANMCTLQDQKQYVRSFLDETYLWYDEILSVNAADFATVPAYFNALLVRTPDSTGQARDRFSAVLTTAGANALQTGKVDSALGAAIPADLLAASTAAVPLTKVITSGSGRKVGYVVFSDHNEGAQDALIAAFESLRSTGIDDLVLDMRYNSGGFLYVAQTAASLITGPQSEGRVFEQLRYSTKRQAETNASTFLFSSKVQTPETVYPRGTPLPQLNLSRLYVLTSSQTCSASESVINSLRGIDVEVILIGDTTCGKPFGFHRQDNCGLAFFAIEFQGFNARNFGDYTGGFKATCPVADNFTTPLGEPREALLAAAIRYIDTGACPTAAPSKNALSLGLPGTRRDHAPLTATPPIDGRLLRPGPR